MFPAIPGSFQHLPWMFPSIPNGCTHRFLFFHSVLILPVWLEAVLWVRSHGRGCSRTILMCSCIFHYSRRCSCPSPWNPSCSWLHLFSWVLQCSILHRSVFVGLCMFQCVLGYSWSTQMCSDMFSYAYWCNYPSLCVFLYSWVVCVSCTLFPPPPLRSWFPPGEKQLTSGRFHLSVCI